MGYVNTKPIYMFFLILLFFSSCNKSVENKSNLEGKWVIKIDNHNIQGVEIMQLCNDSIIIVTDSIRYKANSNKLDVAMDATVLNKGKWFLRNDSIVVSFEGCIISLDTASLEIKIINRGVLRSSTDSIDSEFCSAIGYELRKLYYEGLEYNINLGCPQISETNSLVLKKDDYEMTYKRM